MVIVNLLIGMKHTIMPHGMTEKKYKYSWHPKKTKVLEDTICANYFCFFAKVSYKRQI